MAIQYIANENPDGTVIGGASTTLVSFHGADPCDQYALSSAPAVATTAAINSSISASCFGFTSAQATAIVTLVNALRGLVVEKGLGST